MNDETYLLQFIFPFLQVEMPPNRWILPREARNLCTVEVVHEARIDFSGELATWEESTYSATKDVMGAYLVEELIQQLNVDEHGRRVRQLIRHDVEEDLWAEGVTLGASPASLRLESS